jgi:hypothetical protein
VCDGVGLCFFLLLAGIALTVVGAEPEEVLEAADADDCGVWRRTASSKAWHAVRWSSTAFLVRVLSHASRSFVSMTLSRLSRHTSRSSFLSRTLILSAASTNTNSVVLMRAVSSPVHCGDSAFTTSIMSLRHTSKAASEKTSPSAFALVEHSCTLLRISADAVGPFGLLGAATAAVDDEASLVSDSLRFLDWLGCVSVASVRSCLGFFVAFACFSPSMESHRLRENTAQSSESSIAIIPQPEVCHVLDEVLQHGSLLK